MFHSSESTGRDSTRHLTVLYVAALGAVALMLLFGYVFIDRALTRQASDSHVVNIAGRQRMLSQKLSKESLLLSAETSPQTRLENAEQFRQTLALWESAHLGLQNGDAEMRLPGGNSRTVARMFAHAEPRRRAVSEAARQLIEEVNSGGSPGSPSITAFVGQIQNNEKQFLEGMNEIVFQYDREATARVERLRQIGVVLLLAVLAVLLLEGLAVFRPAVGGIRRTIAELEAAKNLLQNEQASVKLMQTIAVAANESDSIEEAVSLCLNKVCDYTGWSVGHAYLLAEDGTGEMVSADLWHVKNPERFETFRRVTTGTRFAPNVGLPGDVLASGEPKWIADVTAPGVNFPRARQAKDIGVKAGFAFPVLIGAEVVAVLEFFCAEVVAPDEEILNTMAHTGAQLGRVVERKRAQAALQKEREFLSTVFENVADGVVACDAVGAVTLFNRATREICGLPETPISAGQWAEYFDLCQPDGKILMERNQTPLHRALRENSVRGAETVVVPRRGVARRVIASGQAIFDAQGKKRGAVVVMHDITERHRVEQSLRETTTLQRAILDGANYMVIATALDGTITAFNRAAERMTGYAAAAVVGRETPALLHDAGEIARHGEELSAELGAAPEAGREFEFFVTKARMGIAVEREWTVIRRDKTRFPALMSITALRDAAGEVTGYLSIGSDLTGSKQAEEARRASENRFTYLVEHSQGLICTHDLGGNLLTVNPAAARLLGYEPGEMVGRNISEFLAASQRPFFGAHIERVKDRETDSGLFHIVTKSGVERVFQYHNLRYEEAGQEPYIIGYAQDVTELKQAETEVRQLSMTDELTGLYNRRGFLTLTEQQQKVSRRIVSPFSLVYADMDGLKQINDTHGHQEGSEAIRRVAEILRKSFRESDIIARLGGDEFTIFVVDTVASSLAVPLARFEENLRLYNARESHDYPLSVSLGAICVEPEDDSTIEELLVKADKMMYENKRLKKRQATTAEQLIG